jgi:hypothetical protein
MDTDWLFSENEDILSAIRDVFQALLFSSEKLCEQLKNEGRTVGGYVCAADLSGVPRLIVAVGEHNAEKWQSQLTFCQEKARRLAAHSSHILSYESRNPDQNEWGGAVRGETLIISFSGLPERLDEVLSLAILCKLKEVTEPEAFILMGRYDNPFMDELISMDF